MSSAGSPAASSSRERHAADIRRAYVSAQRARLYAVLTGYVGGLMIVAVIGAMVIGWMGIDDGVIALAFTVLVVLVPAAKFYSDSLRTYLNGAALERELDYGEDLIDEAESRHQGIRTFLLTTGVIAAVAAAGIVGFSVANAGTEKPVELFSVSDDDDDDDREGEDENDADDGEGDNGSEQEGPEQEGPEQEGPDGGGGDAPDSGSGSGGNDDD